LLNGGTSIKAKIQKQQVNSNKITLLQLKKTRETVKSKCEERFVTLFEICTHPISPKHGHIRVLSNFNETSAHLTPFIGKRFFKDATGVPFITDYISYKS